MKQPQPICGEHIRFFCSQQLTGGQWSPISTNACTPQVIPKDPPDINIERYSIPTWVCLKWGFSHWKRSLVEINYRNHLAKLRLKFSNDETNKSNHAWSAKSEFLVTHTTADTALCANKDKAKQVLIVSSKEKNNLVETAKWQFLSNSLPQHK